MAVRRSWWVVLLVAVAISGAATWFVRQNRSTTAPPAGPLMLAGDPALITWTQDHVRVGTPYLFQLFDVCVPSADRAVRVSGISAIGASNMTVLGWGVRNVTSRNASRLQGLGAGAGTLRDLPSFVHGQAVAVRCHGNAVVQVEVNVKTTADVGRIKGFAVHYGDDQQLNMPFTVIVCKRDCPAS